MQGPRLSAAAVVTRRNDLLIVDHGPASVQQRWSVPISAVQHGETLVECAVRAVEDTSGLLALSGEFLGWFESLATARDAQGGHRVVMCFEVVVLDPVTPTPGPGVTEARWMPVWDVSELPLEDGLARLLADHGVIDTLV